MLHSFTLIIYIYQIITINIVSHFRVLIDYYKSFINVQLYIYSFIKNLNFIPGIKYVLTFITIV